MTAALVPTLTFGQLLAGMLALPFVAIVLRAAWERARRRLPGRRRREARLRRRLGIAVPALGEAQRAQDGFAAAWWARELDAIDAEMARL